jgi:hypothetical protein
LQDKMMNGRLLRHALLAAALLAAAPAAAQLYKWTDANGRVQYSDRPPPGRKAETVSSSNVSTVTGNPAPAGQAGAVAEPKSAADRDQDFRKRRAEQEEAQKKQQKLAEEQRLKQADCQQAQRQLAGLQSGQRMATVDEKGERRFLEDAEIQQAIQRTQGDIARLCK